MKIHWVWDELFFFRWILHETAALGDKTLHRFQGRKEGGTEGGGGKERMREWGWSLVRDGINCRISVTACACVWLCVCVCVCVCVPHRGLINKWCLKWEQLSVDHLHFMRSACLQLCTHSYTHTLTYSHAHAASMATRAEEYTVALLSRNMSVLWASKCVFPLSGLHHITLCIPSMLMMKGWEALPCRPKQTHTHTRMHINTYLAREAGEH